MIEGFVLEIFSDKDRICQNILDGLQLRRCPLRVIGCRATQPEARPLYPLKVPRLSPTRASAKADSRLMHCNIFGEGKQNDRLAAVSPKSDQVFDQAAAMSALLLPTV